MEGSEGVESLNKFSYMESVNATGTSRWHIRQIPNGENRKLGGGITTPSLCERIQKGWDLKTEVTQVFDPFTCKECLAQYLSHTEKPSST